MLFLENILLASRYRIGSGKKGKRAGSVIKITEKEENNLCFAKGLPERDKAEAKESAVDVLASVP